MILIYFKEHQIDNQDIFKDYYSVSPNKGDLVKYNGKLGQVLYKVIDKNCITLVVDPLT